MKEIQNVKIGVICGDWVTQGHRQCHRSIERTDFLFALHRIYAPVGVKYCEEHVCVSVCLFVRTHIWNKNSSGDEIANVKFYAVRPEATRIC